MAAPHDAPRHPFTSAPRILIIRRDNIGDLVCTLPIFAGLRRHYPNAHLGALVNSYNAPLLNGNPHVDRIHIYTKSKHRPDTGLLAALRDRAALIAGLRQEHYDMALHVGRIPRAEARILVRFGGIGEQWTDDGHGTAAHEVERAYGMLAPLGLHGPPPDPRISVPPEALARARGLLEAQGFGDAIGLHISAREDENRWPLDHFATLIGRGAERGLRFVVFWSPGDAGRPEHPGDDARAQTLLARCQGLPVIGYPTPDLLALATGLAAVGRVVGADGGHVHIAAAVGTSVIGLYCDHKITQWRPWGSGHTVLHGKSVADIPVDAVLATLTNEV